MTGSNVVVDLSHHNGAVDLQKAKAAGIAGVIHKATQGLTYVDPMFAANRQKASDAGLLFGAYHFGTGDDGGAQADFFLQTVQPAAGDLLVLDFEENLPHGPTMTLDQARDFVARVQAVTGRWPGLYGGHYLKESLGAQDDPVLSSCWLWLSQYGPYAVIPSAWDSWTMWQYTDGSVGPEPHPVDGIGVCDRNTYNGTLAELMDFWGVPKAGAETAG
jgi:lysozyme